MQALGIDPGIANTGVAIVETTGTSYALRCHDTIRTSKADPEAARYLSIQCGIAKVIEAHKPDLIAIERVFFGQNITSNQTTAGVIAIALCEAEKKGIGSYLLTPQQIKAASGLSRSATKASLAKVAEGLFGIPFTQRQNHVIDAGYAAICGILKQRRKHQ